MATSFVKTWFLAIRPKTLWAAVAPVIVGSAMAYGDGSFCAGIFAVTLLAAILIQIGTNFANDYYDYVKGADTEERTGPTRATQAGWVTPQTMKFAFMLTFFLAFLCQFKPFACIHFFILNKLRYGISKVIWRKVQ